MAGDWTGRFADPETEERFQLGERRTLLPFVRVYAVLAIAVMVAYAVVNPLFFSREDELRFTILLLPTLLLLGAYFALTFWSRYPDHPIIDFICLLALGLAVTGDNLILFDEFRRLDPGRHASVAIDGLLVSAFAAIALAGRMRWFLLWIALHAAATIAVIVILETHAAGRIYAVLSYSGGAAVVLFINWALGRAHRAAFILSQELEGERAKTEELLYNVLPPAAAQRLKEGHAVADSFSDTSVVFIDIVGFSKLAKSVSPGHLVEVLNAFFLLADRCAERCGVEKVKTIGDAYLAISGGNAPARNSAGAALAFARAVIEDLPQACAATGLTIEVRAGIHSGPVVGGVIGSSRMAYDYWGETMNIASRIESVAQPNGIAVSESTYLRTRSDHEFEEPQTVLLKGVGEMTVYRLNPNPPPA